MTVLDYFVLLIVVVSVVSGLTKGIIRVIVSVAFTVAGLVLAAYCYPYAGSLLHLLMSSWLANLIGFIAVFLIVLFAGSLLSWRLRGVLNRARLGWTDHALGAVFGVLRGWLICSVVYLALTAFPVRPEAVERASLGAVLLQGAHLITWLTSRDLSEKFLNGYELVKQPGQKR
jgi:membrane protein required for colicin V production